MGEEGSKEAKSEAGLGNKIIAASFIILILLANLMMFANWNDANLMAMAKTIARVGFCGLGVGAMIKFITLARHIL